jgi:Leucine-rich repeat (LRR) protein
LVLYNNPLGSFDFSEISCTKNQTTFLLDATGLTSISSVEKAPNLNKLNLRYNSLEGELPVELRELESLRFLSLSNNMYEGLLPDIFEDMPNLETLLLESNRFSGELSTFKLSSKLRLVDLSNNEFLGPIESSFLSNFPSTEHIEVDLSDNKLVGIIPPTFARFEKINLLLKGNL